jgi:hypothetical protein
MMAHFRITRGLLEQIQDHLRSTHPVAFERVGFVACRGASTAHGIVLVARAFYPVADEDYEEDASVGAQIGSPAIQRILQHAYSHTDSMLFVHEHGHRGEPRPSRTDIACWRELIPNFWHVRPELPHGGLILSQDSAMGLLWVPGKKEPVKISKFSVIGQPLRRWSSETFDV